LRFNKRKKNCLPKKKPIDNSFWGNAVLKKVNFCIYKEKRE